MFLAGKTALVTGSTSGIGLGLAKELAKLGANVVMNSFTDSATDHEIAAQISRETSSGVKYIQADMLDCSACRSLVIKTMDAFGSVDILVNNAGIQHVAPVEEFPVTKWDAIIALSLSSPFHTSAAALPLMRTKGWGRIVNIASAHGLRASPYKSAYVAAKHGVIGLTKTVALETAQEQITVNAICPGYVLTPLIESQIPDQMRVHGMDRDTVVRDVLLAKQPSKQFTTIEQIGGIVKFLCSNVAAQITGTAISVDGGWTAQ